MQPFRFDAVELPQSALELRVKVREFLRREITAGTFVPSQSVWTDWNAPFSRRAAEAGFVGMAWPINFGGQARSAIERFVVNEEMLAVGAPCRAHWIADRQTGPQIIKFGSARARDHYVPAMAAGRCFSAIGMSEPDSGSDLASIRTRADRAHGGWVLNGTKVWTSDAHQADILIALVRTRPPNDDRHEGMTQFIVALDTPGVAMSPIRNLAGRHEFNEVTFTDHFVADDMMLGEEGQGWELVTHELVYERGSPDRYMSDYWLIVELLDEIGPKADDRQSAEIGRLVAHLATLRRMSISIAAELAAGREPALAAAILKDIGTAFEQEVPEAVRRLTGIEPDDSQPGTLAGSLASKMFYAPAYTIRGGTREILRNIIARQLGLR